MKTLDFFDLQGNCLWSSPCYSGAHSDIGILRQHAPEIMSAIDEADVIVMDCAFMGFEREATKAKWLIKRHATSHHQLSTEEQKFNALVEEIRRHVEMGYGHVKSRFSVVHSVYRHNRAWLTTIWHYCCALQNLINQHMHHSHRMPLVWTHGVPLIPKKDEKKKKVPHTTCREKKKIDL